MGASATIPSCAVAASELVAQLCRLFFARNWMWFALPVLVLAALAFVNVNFLLVALMTLFVVYPMVLTLVYFNYAFTPEARWSILAKEINLDDDGLHMHFEHVSMQPHTIKWSEVSSMKWGSNSLLLMLRGSKYIFLAIPASELIDEHGNAKPPLNAIRQHFVTKNVA